MIYYENRVWCSVMLPFIKAIVQDDKVLSCFSITEVSPSEGDTVVSNKFSGVPGVKEVTLSKVLDIENNYGDSVDGVAVLILDRLSSMSSGHINSWVFNMLSKNDVVLSALFNSFGPNVSTHIDYSSYKNTIATNKEIVTVYAEKLKNYIDDISKYPLVKEKYRVIRYSTFIRFLKDKDSSLGVTSVAIKSRRRNSYLYVQGTDTEKVLSLFSELKSYTTSNTEAYVMLPDELSDVSIDTIVSALESG